MYLLGCILYAVHNKGLPPFRNHSSLSTLRSHLQTGITVTGMETWDPDLQCAFSLLSSLAQLEHLLICQLALIRLLLARYPASRPAPSTLSTNPFFNSLPISTLNFLDRSTFASKPREEKIAFMKGLTAVLGRFSESLRSRKILPSLLEEVGTISLNITRV
jgi:SCY1-like protein 2